MKTVFILGAGASKEAGGPLMADFLDKAYELERVYGSRLQGAREAFCKIAEVVSDLQGVHIKSFLDLDNIEVLFGAIEMGQLIGKLGSRTEGIEQIYDSIVTLIVKTLENSIEFSEAKGILPPTPYSSFLKVIDELVSWGKSNAVKQSFAFITFNYDISLDYAFQHKHWKPNYALSLDSEGTYPLLKLHGSLNWKICNHCNKIVSIPINLNQIVSVPCSTNRCYIPITDHFKNCPSCNNVISAPSFIVPPTWNKTNYQTTLINVWRKAVKELGEAENIIVIGYSLPETDQFFRYLYALGSQSKKNIKRFWVFNPDTSGETEKRFRDLTARSLEKRFKYYPMTFNESLKHLQRELRMLV